MQKYLANMLSTLGIVDKQANNVKNCPYCAERIKEDAILCKHCNSRLDVEILDPDTPPDYWTFERKYRLQDSSGWKTPIGEAFNAYHRKYHKSEYAKNKKLIALYQSYDKWVETGGYRNAALEARWHKHK